MSTPNLNVTAPRASTTEERARFAATRARPSFYWSDIWKAPLHDFPLRDEILYQFLPLSQEMDVLEIGPGSGATAFRLARQVRKLTLVDVAEESLACLRELLRPIPNLRYVLGDLSRSGLAEALKESFDAAFALDVFEYVPDPATGLQNLAKALRPGGVLLLSFPNLPPPQGDGVTYFSRSEDLEQLLRGAGFCDWEVLSVRLRSGARAAYRLLHEWPLAILRYLRAKDRQSRPQVYDATWAFQQRKHLALFRVPMNLFWAALGKAMRLGGSVFVGEPVGRQMIGHQLVIRARK